MLTVREAMKMEAFRKVKLVAGEEGIDRVIKNVTVMEVPDIVHWIKGGEFIVTSFYSLKDKLQEQCNIIRELNKSNASGIAIKTDKYMSKIPDELIKVANEIKFPVIKIPRDVTYLDIMTPLNRAIFELEQHFRLVEEYIKGIIFHTYKRGDSIIERGKTLGYDIEKGYIYTISIDINGSDTANRKYDLNQYDLISMKDNFYKYIDTIVRGFKREKEIVNYMITRNIEDVTLFLQTDNRISGEKHGKETLNLILKYRDIYYKDMGITIGIANIGQGINGIEGGYDQAKYAIKLGRVIGKKQDYYFYKDLEIYSLFYKNSSDTLFSVVSSTLGKVIDEIELMDTITTYFECNENIMLTSERLFIHKNTLKYRLERIKTITGLDVKNIDDKVKLYFGVIANNILTKKTKN